MGTERGVTVFSDINFRDYEKLSGVEEDLLRKGHGSCRDIRRESWNRCAQELAEAEREERPITHLEWVMGERKEVYESEVREAVISLNNKGYTTYYSGYEGNDGIQVLCLVLEKPLPDNICQNIWELSSRSGVLTWENGFSRLDKSDSLYEEFGNGGDLWIGAIEFIETSGDPNRIKNHWDSIADLLPALKTKSLPNHSDFADDFRRSHKLESSEL